MSDFILREILLEPTRARALNLVEMEQLISQARSARLLASLAIQLRQQETLQTFPHNIRRHFESAILIYEKQQQDLRYECEELRSQLSACECRLILLKGAAYMMADLPVGHGRLITDIDILVPRDEIDNAEQQLASNGWISGYVNSYNERYYRKWSHEIPPMSHAKRGTTLDVHHNILPPTAAPNINAALFFDQLVEVQPGIYTLGKVDMIIHSATHLFHEGEFHHGLRDLWDLDRMLRDFSKLDDTFWSRLTERASTLELTQSLYHALNYVEQVFNTPIPKGVSKQMENPGRRLRKPLMDFLFKRAFRPDHRQTRLPMTGTALYLLYIRSHYLRMPLYLLLPHLARKAWMGRFEKEA